jgi:hypothetical protein
LKRKWREKNITVHLSYQRRILRSHFFVALLSSSGFEVDLSFNLLILFQSFRAKTMASVGSKSNKDFIDAFREKEQFNQYWYSRYTISKVVEEIVAVGGSVAFLSTPSLYFSLPEEIRQNCYVFDVRPL